MGNVLIETDISKVKNMNEYMNESIERIWMPEDVVNTY